MRNVVISLILALVLVACSADPVTWEAKMDGTTGDGDVQVEALPIGMQDGHFQVLIKANTHSVDLSATDLAKSYLEVDGERIYPASTPSLAGHHSEGYMQFPVDAVPNSFSLTIVGLPEQEIRTLRW